MKIYFAHPASTYGTEQEGRIISWLEHNGFCVINPADKIHQDKVKEIRSHAPPETASRQVMDYFFNICAQCDGCAVLAFPDGSFGAGVVGEANTFLARQKEVFEIVDRASFFAFRMLESFEGRKCLTVAETRTALGVRKRAFGN